LYMLLVAISLLVLF